MRRDTRGQPVVDERLQAAEMHLSLQGVRASAFVNLAVEELFFDAPDPIVLAQLWEMREAARQRMFRHAR